MVFAIPLPFLDYHPLLQPIKKSVAKKYSKRLRRFWFLVILQLVSSVVYFLCNSEIRVETVFIPVPAILALHAARSMVPMEFFVLFFLGMPLDVWIGVSFISSIQSPRGDISEGLNPFDAGTVFPILHQNRTTAVGTSPEGAHSNHDDTSTRPSITIFNDFNRVSNVVDNPDNRITSSNGEQAGVGLSAALGAAAADTVLVENTGDMKCNTNDAAGSSSSCGNTDVTITDAARGANAATAMINTGKEPGTDTDKVTATVPVVGAASNVHGLMDPLGISNMEGSSVAAPGAEEQPQTQQQAQRLRIPLSAHFAQGRVSVLTGGNGLLTRYLMSPDTARVIGLFNLLVYSSSGIAYCLLAWYFYRKLGDAAAEELRDPLSRCANQYGSMSTCGGRDGRSSSASASCCENGERLCAAHAIFRNPLFAKPRAVLRDPPPMWPCAGQGVILGSLDSIEHECSSSTPRGSRSPQTHHND
eukprot:Lankesteria_metandrocarpae@DN9119_c0_g1_i1.p1